MPSAEARRGEPTESRRPIRCPSNGGSTRALTLGNRHPDENSPTSMLTSFVVSASRTLVYDTHARSRLCFGGQEISDGGGTTVRDAVTSPFSPEVKMSDALTGPQRDGLEVTSERGRLGRSGAGRLVPAPDTPIRPGLARTLHQAPAQGKEALGAPTSSDRLAAGLCPRPAEEPGAIEPGSVLMS
jgi:hypothetical protein